MYTCRAILGITESGTRKPIAKRLESAMSMHVEYEWHNYAYAHICTVPLRLPPYPLAHFLRRSCLTSIQYC